MVKAVSPGLNSRFPNVSRETLTMTAFTIVALDGPSGVGKSSTGIAAAQRLGFYFLSSGRIYRALAWVALSKGWVPGTPVALKLLNTVVIDPEAQGKLRVNGVLLGEELGSEALSQATSQLSTQPSVRELSNRLQRDTLTRMARQGTYAGVILEGRDIGTVVYPDAPRKIFLTASVAERARRRFEERAPLEPGLTLAEVERSIAERDHRDSTRDVAPLKAAQDALLLDSSQLTLDEVVRVVCEYIKQG